MPRLVLHTATGPTKVTTKSGDEVWICRCGLTDNEDGTCSSHHKQLKEDPEKLYIYDEDKKASLVEEEEEEEIEDGCCGGGCHCGH